MFDFTLDSIGKFKIFLLASIKNYFIISTTTCLPLINHLNPEVTLNLLVGLLVLE